MAASAPRMRCVSFKVEVGPRPTLPPHSQTQLSPLQSPAVTPARPTSRVFVGCHSLRGGKTWYNGETLQGHCRVLTASTPNRPHGALTVLLTHRTRGALGLRYGQEETLTKHPLHGTHRAHASYITSNPHDKTVAETSQCASECQGSGNSQSSYLTRVMCRGDTEPEFAPQFVISQAHHKFMTAAPFMEVNKKVVSSISFMLQMGKLKSCNIIA